MSKVYKGYELIKAIADGEIKEDTKFREMEENRYYMVKDRKLWEQEDTGIYNSKLESLQITYGVFELIEDETRDEIEPINAYKLIEAPCMARYLRGNQFDKFTEELKQSELELVDKINKLVDKVKQLNKEIKELKERRQDEQNILR